jgi:hypothetical protein
MLELSSEDLRGFDWRRGDDDGSLEDAVTTR